jgi:hypothetical protein
MKWRRTRPGLVPPNGLGSTTVYTSRVPPAAIAREC